MNRTDSIAARRRVGLFAVAVLVMLSGYAAGQTVDSVRVMSYNILVGGARYGPLSRTVGVIDTAQADIIGIQEVGGSAQAIANALGFHYHGFNSDIAIISRFPIVNVENQGVKVQLSPTQQAYLFDIHFAPYPYQPYDFRDGIVTTESQAIASAEATRGGSVTTILNDMSSALATNNPVFLVGDFNEPSHLDWTQEAASAGLHFGKKVAWPASTRITNAGLTDAFRELRPDEINDPGNTWTPGYPAPTLDANEVHDRIDIVYYSGLNVVPSSAQTYGYTTSDGSTDVAIQPYPSDHRAVVVEFDIPLCALFADLNGSCSVDATDWAQFRSGQFSDMTGLSQSQAYSMGDLTGDFRNDHADFILFKSAYDVANGAGSFMNMLNSVPEPAGPFLAAWILVVWAGIRRR